MPRHIPPEDTQYQDLTITSVESFDSGGWAIGMSNGCGFCVPDDSPITPAVGMACRLYGRGLGSIVRGLYLGGQKVYYRSEAEQDEKNRRDAEEAKRARKYDFEKNRSDMDKRYRALPVMFQQRLDRFRRNNPDFRWEYEGYELFCIEQAIVIAEAFRGELGPDASSEKVAECLNAFREMPWEDQAKRVPGLDDGHSGNTFGCALALASAYLSEPEYVPRMHGAMSPLVGSVEYGDVASEKE